MTAPETETAPPLAGTWTADAVHTDIVFKVRHMGVGKSSGSFALQSGTLTFAGDTVDTGSVTASIDAASVQTKNDMRDNHVKSADFLDTENHPTIDFVSTGIKDFDGETFVLVGNLTIRGVTQPIELASEVGGVGVDAFGKTRAGFSAVGSFNRKDFGVSFSAAFGVGNSVVSDKVEIAIDIEFVKDEA